MRSFLELVDLFSNKALAFSEIFHTQHNNQKPLHELREEERLFFEYLFWIEKEMHSMKESAEFKSIDQQMMIEEFLEVVQLTRDMYGYSFEGFLKLDIEMIRRGLQARRNLVFHLKQFADNYF